MPEFKRMSVAEVAQAEMEARRDYATYRAKSLPPKHIAKTAETAQTEAVNWLYDRAATYLQTGHANTFLDAMSLAVEQYPAVYKVATTHKAPVVKNEPQPVVKKQPLGPVYFQKVIR